MLKYLSVLCAAGILFLSCVDQINTADSSYSEQNAAELLKAGNTKIAFHRGLEEDDHEIWTMNPDGSDELQLTYESGHDGYPDLSPNGKKIAFEKMRDGINDIWIMNADGTAQTQLTFGTINSGDPDWSPNGKVILFGRFNGDICTIKPDGSDMKVLHNTGFYYFPSPVWSPNGEKIAFNSGHEESWEIYVMEKNGTNILRLTNNDDYDRFPSWSPNGKNIGFISDRDGNREVYVMKSNGLHQTRLTYIGEIAWSNPVWSPNGKQIAFDAGPQDQYQIYIIDAEGGLPIEISDNPERDIAPDWGKVKTFKGK